MALSGLINATAVGYTVRPYSRK